LTLAPYSFLWLELQPASVKPREIAEPLPEIELAAIGQSSASQTAVPDMYSAGWASLFSQGRSLLESELRDWLPRQRWFGAKTRTIQALRVVDWVELPSSANGSDSPESAAGQVSSALVFLQIGYTDGTSDTYQLPLAYSTGSDAEELSVNHPESIIANLTSPSGSAILHDATVDQDFRRALLNLIERNTNLALNSADHGTADVSGADSSQDIEGSERATGLATGSLDGPLEGPIASPMPTGDSTPVPAPLDAQPGEAASAARSDGPARTSTGSMKPRESLEAGDFAMERHLSKARPAQGQLDARSASAFAELRITPDLPSRVGSAEQSNTSILYGRELILKLFRRLQPGENPDVEIGRFLTEVARFSHIAPFLGEISITPAGGNKTTVAMLQGLVANQGDGWQWFLDELALYFAAISSLPAPPESPAPGLFNEQELLPEARDHAGPSLEAAALLGRRTAEMHLALATPTGDPAFAAEPLTHADLNNDARRIDAQITSTLEALKIKFSTLKDLTADDAGLLLSRRLDLFARAHAITTAQPSGQRIRIHGDYHLGQTLRTQGTEPGAGEMQAADFVLLDFEGEPARPLSERRQKQSPLKDVAGMLRSFSYAAHAGLHQYLSTRQDAAHAQASDNPAAWTRLWQNSISSEFLRAYRETIAVNPSLLPSPQQSQLLLNAYMLEKALYELLYELNNRPTWLRIPLSGILAL
jgi:maltose alpha-D-glucosyltransferase/alpha-amylase